MADPVPGHDQDPAGQAPDPRGRAVDIPAGVLRKGRPYDDLLAEDAARAGAVAAPVDGSSAPEDLRRDRAFVRHLTATALRRLGQIDALIGHCLDRPLPPGAGEVTEILRIGVAQLLFMSVPAHAAVDESVNLADRRGHHRFKNLVNAVLRRIAREGEAIAATQDAARYNTPDWLWQSWVGAYGEEVARAIARAHLLEAPLDITARGDPRSLADPLGATLLPTGTLRRAASGPVEALPGYADGAWWVQDAAAAIPARLFGDIAGARVVDLCAAPGGKTAQLAAAGAEVVAVDRAANRLLRLQRNMERLRLPVEVVAADALLWRPAEPADAVLLDAPCTATGTIRRHPDIPWSKSPQDLSKLTTIQGRLLRAAIEMVRPGGLLVYCTCSLQPEEGERQITALLAGNAPVRVVPIRPDEVGGLDELIGPTGALRTLPCHIEDIGGIDGFYAVRLQRV